MKVLQARSGDEIHAFWWETTRRLIHGYLQHRNKRCASWRSHAENRIVATYEGRSWCDATERELIGDITKIHHGSQL